VHPAGTLFETGTVQSTSVRIALAVAGAGNRAAAALVERAVATFQPDRVFLVGIAGALHTDIVLGDVVVATRVYSYHGGQEEAAQFFPRPRAWDADHSLEQRARQVARTGSWERLLPHRPERAPVKVHFRPVAAGEVVLNSSTGQLADLIRRHYNDVAAIEMESAGAAEAAHLNGALPVLTIRGISDRADGQKLVTDAVGWQPLAASHAAAFAVALATEIHAGLSAKDRTDSGNQVPPGPARTEQPRGGTITMQATAYGQSRVYQAGGDQEINES
jgi:nucleoside phosphorylase